MREELKARARRNWAWRTAAAAGLAASLVGCISIFPTEKPAQLYRFTYSPTAAASPVAPQSRFTVRPVIASFDRASSSDRILTANGEMTAYIAGARWVVSAFSLFGDAVYAAFDQKGPAVLIGQGELGTVDYRLTLDVRTFEARYVNGPASAPTAVVEIDAALMQGRPPFARQDKVFRAEAPAGANSVAAIVAAYDQAVSATLSQLVAWVEAKGSP